MRTPGIDIESCFKRAIEEKGVKAQDDSIKAAAVEIKYQGYITKTQKQFEKLKKLGNRQIKWQDLADSSNISFECKQRIKKIQPDTFGKLRNIEGIRPATLAYVSGTLS